MNEQEQLSVVVRSRERKFFEGKATGVTSTNDRGLFDVLPQHENFISIIHKSVIVHTAQGAQEITLERGVLQVDRDEVYVYIV